MCAEGGQPHLSAVLVVPVPTSAQLPFWRNGSQALNPLPYPLTALNCVGAASTSCRLARRARTRPCAPSARNTCGQHTDLTTSCISNLRRLGGVRAVAQGCVAHPGQHRGAGGRPLLLAAGHALRAAAGEAGLWLSFHFLGSGTLGHAAALASCAGTFTPKHVHRTKHWCGDAMRCSPPSRRPRTSSRRCWWRPPSTSPFWASLAASRWTRTRATRCGERGGAPLPPVLPPCARGWLQRGAEPPSVRAPSWGSAAQPFARAPSFPALCVLGARALRRGISCVALLLMYYAIPLSTMLQVSVRSASPACAPARVRQRQIGSEADRPGVRPTGAVSAGLQGAAPLAAEEAGGETDRRGEASAACEAGRPVSAGATAGSEKREVRKRLRLGAAHCGSRAQVIKQRNAASIYIPLAVAAALNGGLWCAAAVAVRALSDAAVGRAAGRQYRLLSFLPREGGVTGAPAWLLPRARRTAYGLFAIHDFNVSPRGVGERLSRCSRALAPPRSSFLDFTDAWRCCGTLPPRPPWMKNSLDDCRERAQVYMPNLVGALLALLQLALRFAYGAKDHHPLDAAQYSVSGLHPPDLDAHAPGKPHPHRHSLDASGCADPSLFCAAA